MKVEDFLAAVYAIGGVVGWIVFFFTLIFAPSENYIFAFILYTLSLGALGCYVFSDENTLKKVIFTRRNKRK